MAFLNNFKTAVLLGAMISLCMLVGKAMGGNNGLLFGLMFGGMGSIFSYFFSDKLAVMAMGGREVHREDLPWLYDTVERLAQRAGLPMPRVYICPQEAPNAFATGRNPRHSAVAVTQGLLRDLPEDEIEGVLAHELGHVKHRDVLISTIAAVLAGIISYAGYMAMWFGGGSRDRDNPLAGVGGVLMLLLAPLAAGLIQMAISRSREYEADRFGGELCGDPRKLARALQRLAYGNERISTDTPPAFHNMYIMEPLRSESGGGMLSLFLTHPPTEKRVAELLRQAELMELRR